MGKVESRPQVSLKNILFLTDFSEPSEAALPFATSFAREYGAATHLERATAHKVVAHALCPVLTVRERPLN